MSLACQIVLIKPPGFEFVEGFREVMESLQQCLADQGCTAPIRVNRIEPGAIPVFFGAHHLPLGTAGALPADSIVFNLEQLAPGYPWYREDYLALLQRYRVWDYSARNVAHLRSLGGHAVHVPIGYARCLTRIAPAPSEDVDVLFYGLATPRRQAVLKALASAGLRVAALHNVWGVERDAWIARAKLVLNLHAYEGGDFEIVRIMYLLANQKAVVCEVGEHERIDDDLSDGILAVPYDELVDACRTLCADAARRAFLAAAGHAAITQPDRAMRIDRAMLTEKEPA